MKKVTDSSEEGRYLPAIMLAEHGVFGLDHTTKRVGLLQLMVPELFSAAFVIICQLVPPHRLRHEITVCTLDRLDWCLDRFSFLVLHAF